MKDVRLWGDVEIPPWNLEKFYALFNAIKGKKASEPDRNEFALMLMYQIHLKVRSEGWKRSLNQHRIEHAEAAAIVLGRLHKKLPRFKLNNPCPKVLIASIATTIERELISVVRGATRKTRMPEQQSPEDYDHADKTFSSPALSSLATSIRDAAASVCGHHKWRRRAFDYMAKSVLSGRLTPALDEMPKRIADKIGADGHAHIAFHISRLIARHAEDLSPQAG